MTIFAFAKDLKSQTLILPNVSQIKKFANIFRFTVLQTLSLISQCPTSNSLSCSHMKQFKQQGFTNPVVILFSEFGHLDHEYNSLGIVLRYAKIDPTVLWSCGTCT